MRATFKEGLQTGLAICTVGTFLGFTTSLALFGYGAFWRWRMAWPYIALVDGIVLVLTCMAAKTWARR